MKVITFNIRNADDNNGHSIAERAPRLKTILDKYDGDIVCFQEVTPIWLKIIEEDYFSKYHIFNKFRCKAGPIEGSAILWKKNKFTELDNGYFWFSNTPWVESLGDDYLYHCHRMCQWINLKDNISGKEFYIFNLHFGFGDDYQVQSVNLIKQSVDALEAKNVIITGDFNAQRNSAAHNQMIKFFTDVNDITKKYQGNTYHAYGEEQGKHIDYIFISSDTIKAEDYIVIDDLIDGKYPSDHYGLSIDLE